VIKPDKDNYSPLFWVAVLNSKLQAHIYKLLSQEEDRVFAEVKPANLRKLPIRRIHFKLVDAERNKFMGEIGVLAGALVGNARELPLSRTANGFPYYKSSTYRSSALGQYIAVLLLQDAQGNILTITEGASGTEERSDVVHDLLAVLAEQMIVLNKQKRAEIKRFLGWLEAQLEITSDKEGRNGIDSLPNKTTLQNYLGDYQKNEEVQPWDSFFAVLHKNRRRFVNDYWVVDDKFRPRIKAEYEKSLATLLPIKERLARTDALIDQIVYQLYGLTPAEIVVVEGA
jgi:hypothetical protein